MTIQYRTGVLPRTLTAVERKWVWDHLSAMHLRILGGQRRDRTLEQLMYMMHELAPPWVSEFAPEANLDEDKYNAVL
jgi:hypothetical protein